MKKNQHFQEDPKSIDLIYQEALDLLCAELKKVSRLKGRGKIGHAQDFWDVFLSIVDLFSQHYCSKHKNKRNIKKISLNIFDEDFASLSYIPKANYVYYRAFNLHLNTAFFIDLINIFIELIPVENSARTKIESVASQLQTSFKQHLLSLEKELDLFLKNNRKDLSLFALLGRILSGRQMLFFNLVIKTSNVHLIQNINLQSAQIEFFAKHGKRLNKFNLAA